MTVLAWSLFAGIAGGLAAGAVWGLLENRISPRRRVPIDIVTGDITRETTDVIVNAAKRSLLGGGGVDGAIHCAGGPAILNECRALRRLPEYRDGLQTGHAVATGAGDLAAQWVIHTVGPVYPMTTPAPAQQLRDCYTNSLNLADTLGARTVAFPLISSGVYGWPVEDAIRQALTAIRAARPSSVKRVRLVLFDEKAMHIADKVLKEFA